MKAELFFEFSASQLFRIDFTHLPSALRQLKAALLNGISKLLDKPYAALAVSSIEIQRDNDRAVFLVDDAIDSGFPVGAENLVFAKRQPGIAINLPAGERADAVLLRRLVCAHG
jgi:hypothetical protein